MAWVRTVVIQGFISMSNVWTPPDLMHTRALDTLSSAGIEFQVHCAAKHSKGKFLHFSSAAGGAEELWLHPDVDRNGVWHWLGCSGKLFLGKAKQWRWCLRSCCWYHWCGSVHIVQLSWQTVSRFPEAAPPALCPWGTLPWYLQIPKCSGIFVFPAEGHWVPSVSVPYWMNHFASEKYEGRTWEDLLLLDQSEIFPECLGIGD